MASRTTQEIRTTFSAEGVESVVSASDRIASATSAALEKTGKTASAAHERLAAMITASNKAMVASETQRVAVTKAQQTHGGGMALLGIRQRYEAMQEVAKAAQKKVSDQVEAMTKAAMARQLVLVKEWKQKLRSDMEVGLISKDEAKDMLRKRINETRGSARKEGDAARSVASVGNALNAEAKAAIADAAAYDRLQKARAEDERKQREAYKQIRAGAREMATGVKEAFKVVKSGAHVAYLGVKKLSLGIVGLTRRLLLMGTTAAHAFARLGGSLFMAPIHAVRSLGREIGHVIGQLGRLAAHKAIQYAKAGIAAYGAVGAASTALAKKSVGDTQERAMDVRDKSFDARMTTDQYQAWTGAAKMVGADSAAVMKSLDAFRDALDKANADPHSAEARTLDSLAVRRTDINGRALNFQDVFLQYARQQQARAPYGYQKEQLADMFLGGRNAVKDQQFYDTLGERGQTMFAEGLQREQAFGTYLSPQDIERMRQFRALSVDIHDAWKGVENTIAEKVLPLFATLTKIGTSFLTTYNKQIGDFISNRVKSMAMNAAELIRIIYMETQAYHALAGSLAERATRTQGPEDTLVFKGYVLYIKYVRQGLHQVTAAAKTAYASLAALAHAMGMDTFSGTVNRLKEAVLWLRQFAGEMKLVAQGKDYDLTGHPILERLAVARNQAVAYVQQTWAGMKNVWKGESTDQDMETFGARALKKLMSFARGVRSAFKTIKAEIHSGIAFIKKLWTELQTVLGGGEGKRGVSKEMPALNGLIKNFDELRSMATDAWQALKTVHGWVKSLLSVVAGSKAGKWMMIASIISMTGAFRVGIPLLKGFGSALSGIVKLATGAGILAGIRNLLSLGKAASKVGGGAVSDAVTAAGTASRTGAADYFSAGTRGTVDGVGAAAEGAGAAAEDASTLGRMGRIGRVVGRYAGPVALASAAADGYQVIQYVQNDRARADQYEKMTDTNVAGTREANDNVTVREMWEGMQNALATAREQTASVDKAGGYANYSAQMDDYYKRVQASFEQQPHVQATEQTLNITLNGQQIAKMTNGELTDLVNSNSILSNGGN